MSEARQPWERMLSFVHSLVREDPWCRDRDDPVRLALAVLLLKRRPPT